MCVELLINIDGGVGFIHPLYLICYHFIATDILKMVAYRMSHCAYAKVRSFNLKLFSL